MSNTDDERRRVLQLLEQQQLSAAEAERLLAALDGPIADERLHARVLRVRISDVTRGRGRVEVRMPLGLVEVGLRLGARLAPRMTAEQLREVIASVRGGASGRIFELQDLDEGERIEVFIE